MLVEAAIGPIHSAALGLLVGHNPQRGTRPPTRPQHLAAVHVLRSPCGAALSVLVEAALGPAVLAVLVEAALGPIHSAAPVETALGPIHDAVLRRSPSPALPVEPAFGGARLDPQGGTSRDGTRPACACRAGRRGARPDPQRGTSRDGARPDPRRGAPPLALARLASRASVWTPPRRCDRQPGWRGIRRAGRGSAG